MVLESLQKVKKAETDLLQRKQEAKGEVAGIVETAQAGADKVLLEKTTAARDQAEQMRSDAEKQAQKECKIIVDQWEKEIGELRAEAQKGLEKAREFIVHSLLS